MNLKNINIRFICFLISILFIQNSYSFDSEIEKPKWLKNRRAKHPLGVNVGMLGPTGWGNISMDYFVDSKFDVEAGLGIQTNGDNPYSFMGGVKYHIAGKFALGTTLYFGVMDAFFFKDGKGHQHNLYFPIGLHKIKRNKFSWGVELAYQYNKYSSRNIWGSFKIGYRIF